MKKIMRLIVLLVGIILISAIASASTDADMENFLKRQRIFTAQDVNMIMDTFRAAQTEGLPMDFIESRIREGAAKNRTAAEINQVINKKIQKLKIAGKFLDLFSGRGLLIENKKYSLQVLGELLENGYPENRFEKIAGTAVGRKIKCEEMLEIMQMQVDLRQKNIPIEETDEIISAAMAKSMNIAEMKIMLGIMWDAIRTGIGQGEAKSIIMEGINKKSIRWIKRNMEELGSGEGARSRHDNVKPGRNDRPDYTKERGRK